MSSEEEMDVIVVGAGLAGLACAYEAAQQGLQVLVLERGEVAGSKNLSGGRLYLEPLSELSGDLLKDAPFEREVVSETITLTDHGGSVSFRVEMDAEDGPPQSVTVLRAKLDQFLAERIAEKEAFVLGEQRVEGLIIENDTVVGVKAGPEELRAKMVVAADGALSFLAEEAGLRRGRPVHTYGVGIKEIIALESSKIEERFNVASGQGAARLFLGTITRGLPGGGFIYTNKDSLSIGLVIQMNALQGLASEEKLPDLMEAFKGRKDIAPIIAVDVPWNTGLI